MQEKEQKINEGQLVAYKVITINEMLETLVNLKEVAIKDILNVVSVLSQGKLVNILPVEESEEIKK